MGPIFSIITRFYKHAHTAFKKNIFKELKAEFYKIPGNLSV